MKLSSFRGHRYRRYTVALRLLALAWIPYAAQSFFIYPSLIAFLASAFLIAAGSGPLWFFSLRTELIAKEEFIMRRKQPTTLLGVVGPKGDK